MFKNFVKMFDNKAKMSYIGAQMFECSTLKLNCLGMQL